MHLVEFRGKRDEDMGTKIFYSQHKFYHENIPGLLELFSSLGGEIVYAPEIESFSESEAIELFKGCDICIVAGRQITAEMMDTAPNLKLIAVFGAGYNNVDTEAAKERGIFVTNAKGANANAVAEYTIALMLDLCKRILPVAEDVHNNRSHSRMGCEMRGKTYGIVGTGAIGTEVARIAHLGFGMNIIAYSGHHSQECVEKYGVRYVDLETLFRDSDFISIHAPLKDSTRSFINYELMSLMKPTAYIVNTARGGIIDEEDLKRILVEGKIAGAACDVFVHEPINSSNQNPFAGFEQDVFIGTSHNAGGTMDASMALADVVMTVVKDVLSGQRPSKNIVNGL